MEIPTPPTAPQAGRSRSEPDHDDPPKSGFTADGGPDGDTGAPAAKDAGSTESALS